MCPYSSKSYEEQITEKAINHNKYLIDLMEGIQQANNAQFKFTPDELTRQAAKVYEGLSHSKSVTNYRNKCEFTVGMDGTVGFRLGELKALLI